MISLIAKKNILHVNFWVRQGNSRRDTALTEVLRFYVVLAYPDERRKFENHVLTTLNRSFESFDGKFKDLPSKLIWVRRQ